MTTEYSNAEIAFLQSWIGLVYDRFDFCNVGAGRCKVWEGQFAPGLWCRIPEHLRDRGAEIVSRLAAELDSNGWLGNRGVKADVRTNGSGRYLIVERRAGVTFEDVKRLWGEFSEIPVDNDDCIERPFLHFEAGTDRFDVWRWFDERCPRGMARDLLGMK